MNNFFFIFLSLNIRSDFEGRGTILGDDALYLPNSFDDLTAWLTSSCLLKFFKWKQYEPESTAGSQDSDGNSDHGRQDKDPSHRVGNVEQ